MGDRAPGVPEGPAGPAGQPGVPEGASGPAGPAAHALAAGAVRLLVDRQRTVAVAESLTGGLLGAALTAVPGSSAVFRGGIIAYATELKETLLGVSGQLLAVRGAVDPDVAAAMADGVRRRLGAAAGVATTGVAGPGPAEGKPAGTVHIAVSTASGAVTSGLALPGGRAEVREETVRAALALLVDCLREEMR